MTRCNALLPVPDQSKPGGQYKVRCLLEEHPLGTLCYAETDEGRVRRRWDRNRPDLYHLYRVGT